MSVTKINDVVIPEQFTAYQVENSLDETPILRSGIVVPNGVMAAQLKAGAHNFTVPFFNDLTGAANVSNDDPASFSTPGKIGAGRQVVRKSFLNASWSNMALASELASADVLGRIQDRVKAFWDRELEARMIASLVGLRNLNAAGTKDMITTEALFNAASVIKAAGTKGMQMRNLSTIVLHPTIYQRALTNDLIETIQDSQGGFIQTFRGLEIIVSDKVPVSEEDDFTSILLGAGAFGYAVSKPTYSDGTEVVSIPNSGMGGGQHVLHSRLNVAMHPGGFSFVDTAVESESPTLAELQDATNWLQVLPSNAINIAFLETK